MTTHAEGVAAYVDKAARKDIVTFEASQVIGASGAVGAIDADDPAFTIAKNAGAGTYDVTFPKGVKGRLYVNVVSPAGTVVGAYAAAFSATAGTAQVITVNGAGAATNPASSDVLHVMLRLDSRP